MAVAELRDLQCPLLCVYLLTRKNISYNSPFPNIADDNLSRTHKTQHVGADLFYLRQIVTAIYGASVDLAR